MKIREALGQQIQNFVGLNPVRSSQISGDGAGLGGPPLRVTGTADVFDRDRDGRADAMRVVGNVGRTRYEVVVLVDRDHSQVTSLHATNGIIDAVTVSDTASGLSRHYRKAGAIEVEVTRERNKVWWTSELSRNLGVMAEREIGYDPFIVRRVDLWGKAVDRNGDGRFDASEAQVLHDPDKQLASALGSASADEDL